MKARIIAALVAALVAGVLLGTYAAHVRTVRTKRPRGKIEDFTALRTAVYETLAVIPGRCPAGTRVRNAASARGPRMFPDNKFVTVEAGHKVVKHYSRARWSLAVDDELIRKQSADEARNLAAEFSDHYTAGLAALGFEKLHGHGGHSFETHKGTRKTSQAIWVSACGHITVTVEVRVHLEAKDAEIDISVLELY